jgi:hypothetical protein
MTKGRRIFVVGLLAVATVPVVYVVTRGSAGEPLTPERLAAAEALWKERGPRDYALDVEVPGARHHVEVRDGNVVGMTTDGNEVRDSAWARWNVEGMFGFLSAELSNRARAKELHGAAPDDVILRAAFDGRYGYPRRFLRHVQGSTRSVEWDVRLSPR